MPEERAKGGSLAKTLIQLVVRMGLFGLLIFGSAGTLRWWEAWALLAIFVVYAAVATAYLARRDPKLLAERLRASPVQHGQPTWDRVLMVLMLLFGLPMYVVPGLDLRYELSSVPVALEVVGLLVIAIGMGGVFFVMRENTFLSRVVKIDESRGHEVITTGPYRIVRHPMYAIVIPVILAFPLALGSYVALPLGLVLALLLVVRTALEDRTLHRELEGYAEYAKRTRYRLLPGLW